MQSQTHFFYRDLEPFTYVHNQPADFFDTLINKSKELPFDWSFASLDIIHANNIPDKKKYIVHFIATSCVAIILNKAKELDMVIPFVSNGDGLIFAMPSSIQRELTEALLSFQKYCKTKFHVSLRIGFLPYSEVKNNFGEIKVLKNIDVHAFHSSLFVGSGVSRFMASVKNGEHTASYLDFVYLEPYSLQNFVCPWQTWSIPNNKDFAISLIIEPQLGSFDSAMNIIARASALIDTYCGTIEERSIEPHIIEDFPHTHIKQTAIMYRAVILRSPIDKRRKRITINHFKREPTNDPTSRENPA